MSGCRSQAQVTLGQINVQHEKIVGKANDSQATNSPSASLSFGQQQQRQQQLPLPRSQLANSSGSSLSSKPPAATSLQQQQQNQSTRSLSSTGGQCALASSSAASGQSGMSISRQHLSARVKTITGKLLDSHGAELRRTLFSLRQIFQDDLDLATEFADSDGLECLLKVAVDADQIHQNYILRALGQLIACPSGMNGLARHNETIQWLYTLLSSQHRLVVKTSIKLLLQFVEDSDNNCLHFCRAIKSIEESKGASLWTNLNGLIKNCIDNQQQQDVSLLVDAMTLINKTLAGIPDQDTYYDFVLPLEKLGIEKIIKNNSSLDSQLREQFDIYEQVLRAEDEDSSCLMNSLASNIDNTAMEKSNRIANAATAQGNISEPQNNRHDQTQAKRRSRRVWKPTIEVKCGDVKQQQQKGVELNDNDNYESANESNESVAKASESHKKAAMVVNAPTSTTTPTTPTNTSTPPTSARYKSLKVSSEDEDGVVQRPTNKQQPLQRVQQNQQKSNHQHLGKQNLARGKQQRASISSCSSSDSYASYGSGYASGSGNSTDLEHKQRSLSNGNSHNNTAGNKNCEQKANSGQAVAARKNSPINANTNESQGAEDDDDAEDEVEEEEEEEEDSQLKQHLSELEQLTDELSSRNIFGTHNQPIQSTSKHFSSTIKSTSSNSSSILSTGSHLSSLSASTNGSVTISTGGLKKIGSTQAASTSVPQTPSAPTSSVNNDSRSTSATPTSTIQPSNLTSPLTASSSLTSASSPYMPAYLSSPSSNGEQIAYQAKISRPAHQCVTPAATNLPGQQQKQPQAQHQQQSSTNATSNGSVAAKQEPYYHNLFQWEQLASKGVTRPLLINDLDFTDLRDEDDCDLLNSSNANGPSGMAPRARHQGEPLTINIPGVQHIQKLNEPSDQDDSIDSGTGTGSPKARGSILGTPASAPPPMPPPPISPWFNTIAGSRPQSQFMSSPSPPYEQQSSGEFNRDQSPANSTYSNYSRNSVCLPQTSTPTREASATVANASDTNHHQYNTLQPVTSLRSASSMSSLLFGNNSKYANKRKKTMKLFWKEVREDRSLLAKLTKKRTIWDEIKPIPIDTQKLEHLFESKAKDLQLSKSRNGLDGTNQRKVKITVLDAKRSNAINIGMTKLPPMRTIKNAILKMDSSIMNREGIEKILTTMMPSEEEKSRIIEAQLANPDTPLGTAEQFLLNLASISALEARLKLWAFQLDYAQIEKEVAEPLMDLKQAIEEIERSETFRVILGTLLAIGNFLNCTNVKGFQIDYLEKVPEVKDTVHKHSLLHHLCLFIQEKYDPQLAGDLYSEFSAVNRASKVDYAEVAKNLKKMQQDCKASWDYLKIVAKHDGLANLMNTSNSSSSTSSSATNDCSLTSGQHHQPLKSAGKLNNLSKLSMITTITSSDGSSANDQQQAPTSKQLKTKVSDFLTDCAERIMVLMVIHRRVMNRFQKLLVYLGCPSHQIKQTQPQQILKIINEFALEYRTKRERVREMLMKKQQCQHHHHAHSNRWQLNRTRWAGSHQCIDSLGYSHHLNRPCSTTSSCASSYTTNTLACTDSMCNISTLSDQRHHTNQQHGAGDACLRAGSPSGFSQISNYSDYLFDQSCCNSRQQSVTPVPSEKARNGLSHQGNINSNHQQQLLNRRPHSMSVSMFDLQNQQRVDSVSASVNRKSSTNGTEGVGVINHQNEEEENEQRRKDEQLRLLLGAGKSFDDTCNELYQMSHWSSTMARVTRHPPSSQGHPHGAAASVGSKQRAASMDESSNKDDESNMMSASDRRQSSYYRYLHGRRCMADEADEQDSDDEILQSLVRTAQSGNRSAAIYGHQNGSQAPGKNRPGSKVQQIGLDNQDARSNKLLSQFHCERKSCE